MTKETFKLDLKGGISLLRSGKRKIQWKGKLFDSVNLFVNSECVRSLKIY